MTLIPLLSLLLVADTAAAFHVPVAPAESLWVSAAGRGEPVVLIPGLVGSVYAYRKVVPLLNEAGYRTVVIEPLGIGFSTRPEAADYSLAAQARRLGAALDSLRTGRAILVAHSLGAAVAFRLALGRPDLVAGIVSLEGVPAESAVTPDVQRALRLEPLIRLLGGAGLLRRKILGEMRAVSGDPSWATEEVVRGYTDGAAADLGATFHAFRAMARSAEPAGLDTHLSEIRCPVIFLVGGFPHRTAPRPQDLELLARRLPLLVVDTLPGAGHYLHEEAPGAVVAAVQRARSEGLRLAAQPGR